ncbi:MAG: hypothetical protein CFH34_01446 [Alphaproteobacteria bacterium MarineAlpha9_Bin4]|nr:hypothetical protein [Pelagibacterales bacterium]PPR25416.1 MAG: hypothetical protein CFH34_01446 [Alphaproteobacteria bacterium MarineAlpha9_Bin4]|tara:strand:- start:1222 stop:1431 length:210 start_codon:yes stop_codon:yes gene_type:complete
MSDILNKKFKNIIEVKTTYIATEAGHPRVYYKINPDIGYIVCNYSNTCFKLSKDADLNTKELYIYKGEI